MKNLSMLSLIALLSSSISHAGIDIAAIQSVELKDRSILLHKELRELKVEKKDGTLDLKKLPDFSNIEFKNGLNLKSDTVLDGEFQRSAEGGQDGGGG